MGKYIKIKEDRSNINQRTIDLFTKGKIKTNLTKEQIKNMSEVQDVAKNTPDVVKDFTARLFKQGKLNEFEYYIFCAKHGLLNSKVFSFSEISSHFPRFDSEKILAVYNSALKIIAEEMAVLNLEESLSV